MSELEDRFVKRGFWINWSQGSVMGRTLTVDSRSGNVVVAILTMCTAVGAAQLFHLAMFLYHQWRAKGSPSDGLFWQQQALLRTLPTPTALVADYVKIWWSWRKRTPGAHLRSWITVILVFCFAVAAIAAGIASSYIVSTYNLEVLVSSPMCGLVNLTSLDTKSYATALTNSLEPVITSYSQNCYQNVTTAPATCRNIFIQPKVPFTVEPAPCPWHSSMCLEGDLPARAMDSGLLDASAQFGWNLKPRDKLWFRKRTTCNVLPEEGHVDIRNMTDFQLNPSNPVHPGEQVVALRYGTYTDGAPTSQYLFYYSLISSNNTSTYISGGKISYLQPFPWSFGTPWLPLPEMNRTDADIVVNAIGLNTVASLTPIEDPVFSAHKLRNRTYSGDSDLRYLPDSLMKAIGCTEQYQFCAAQSKGDKACSPLSGLPSASAIASDLLPNLTELQRALLTVLSTASVVNDVSSGPIKRHIQASDLVTNGFIYGLPSDQWINEIVGWQNFAWAGITTMLTDVAVGPKVRDPLAANNYTDVPTTTGEKLLCQSMKMRKAGGFANINVFGLSFVITFASTIAIINFFILRFFIFLKRFRQALAPRLDRWVNDGVLQLQRRAFEMNGEGVWIDLEKEVPVTLDRTKMSELPMTTRAVTRAATFDTLAETLADKELEGKETEHQSSASGSRQDLALVDSSPDSCVAVDSKSIDHLEKPRRD